MIERKQTFSARRDGVVVEELGGELLVYDRQTDVAHCLSDVAAVAWRAFEDGATVDHAAGQILANGLAPSLEEARTLAEESVSELGERGLLEQRADFIGERVPRRQALRRIAGAGAAAVAGPLVVSAAIPGAAMAASSQTIVYCKLYNSSYWFFELTVSGGSVTNCTGSSFTFPSGSSGCYTQSASFYGSCNDVTYQANYPNSGEISVASTDTNEDPQWGQSFIQCGSNFYRPAGTGPTTGHLSSGSNGNGNGSYLTFSCNSTYRGTSC